MRCRVVVFIDESGSDEPVTRVGARGKARLFVVFGAAIPEDGVSALERAYRGLLSRRFEIVPGHSFAIDELFDLYRRATGRRPEIRAGYLNSRDGPFLLFRALPRALEGRYEEFRREVFRHLLSALVECSEVLIAVVVDKVELHRLSTRIGRPLDPRLVAMDYLFTRVASYAERRGWGVTAVHDETSRANEVAGLLETLKTRGYFYNPRLRHRPRYELIERIEFVDSAKSIPLQIVDLAANVVLNTRAAGAYKELYNIIANTSKYLETPVPGGRRAV